MNKLHDHPHCNLCRIDLEAKLDDYIAVSFTALKLSVTQPHCEQSSIQFISNSPWAVA
jgi:hypothetical protein